MTKITRFDKQLLKNLRTELDGVLAEFAKKYGIIASLGNARFTPNSVNWKFTLAANGGGSVDNPINSVEAATFVNKCFIYGLSKDDLNKTIVLRGDRCKIVGLNPRRHKYPVICENSNGTRYVYSDAEVRAALLAQKLAEAGG
jgi:hypothetical protein